MVHKEGDFRKATFHNVGDSEMVLIPAVVKKEKSYIFKKSNKGAIIENGKDSKGNAAVILRKV